MITFDAIVELIKNIIDVLIVWLVFYFILKFGNLKQNP